MFKGGTCLKKCFFETYRFSEDLDFTVPTSETLSEDTIRRAVVEVTEWAHEESGITFPIDRIEVEGHDNKQGTKSYRAKLSYSGPLGLPRSSQQRIKFDITRNEILVDPPDHREIFHGYSDARFPPPTIACYSINEILAEKTRALYERRGRARDVYDIVHISRNFRNDISVDIAARIVAKKFAFKGIDLPTPEQIIAKIDKVGLQTNWDQQLRHQLPLLPKLSGFTGELLDALAWWMEPASTHVALPPIPPKREVVLPRVHFQHRRTAGAPSVPGLPDPIRFAARNRRLARFLYHDSIRTVEPYSLRRKGTGNVLLYAFEISKGSDSIGGIRSYKVDEIYKAEIVDLSFSPRWAIEL